MTGRIVVRSDRTLVWRRKTYRCALGPAGITLTKREGDKATPAGVFPLRRALYRADRLAEPATGLPLAAVGQDDGWCDDPGDAYYNRAVALPYPASHEKLWREDGLYDVVVVIGYNDDPVVPGAGSAIFMHIAKPDYAPTEGCVALARDDLLALLGQIGPDTVIEISP